MDNSIAIKILDLIRHGREGLVYLSNCIDTGEVNVTNLVVLDSLEELLASIESVARNSDSPNRVKEINQNLFYYIQQVKDHVLNDRVNPFLFDFQFHVKSLFRILEFEIAYIVERFVDKHLYPDFYTEVGIIDKQMIESQGNNARYKISIVLLAYNNLDFTRQCLESILLYSNDVDYELILVDNGSIDGTKTYFETIPNAKVIHLKYNIHLVKGFNMGLMAAEGKYCAAVCNDFIFTSNWLSNLLVCIESDKEIGFVSPGATSISNMQQITIPFTTIEEFQNKALAYNVSDSTKWEDRVVLLPNVLFCPAALLERIGYYDTRFYRGEFLDDDISFRIRRAGYRLVYCADTVTYHYGSLTTSSDHQTNSLEEGRRTFNEKYGIDAWLEARMSPYFQNISIPQLSNVKRVLGIDVKCGATLLQIKNKLWSEFGARAHLTAVTTMQKYEVDLKTIADETIVLDNENIFSEEMIVGKYDLIFIEKPLNEWHENQNVIFNSLSRYMNENGKLIFFVKNSIGIDSIYDFLSEVTSRHNEKIFNRELLIGEAREHGFYSYSIINLMRETNREVYERVKNLSEILTGGNEQNMRYVETVLLTDMIMYELNFSRQEQ
ncbi:glycosyltransferase family 2 protein [Paenibacillus herberti]|uniref:Glycosyltransferase 2-like domain-containing protein n=1 Tax=Paenibacillus herberti TaxID=1619309 RepID=A0A229NW14_9BACL|nr:glycosyltransferase [Paenibacillus herberti]OXM14116.1 hypothetical protein CGZ75_14165 [Paenibacillus herberti]